MTFSPEIAAMRWGYGLPLPKGAPTDPEAMLVLLSGPDVAATDTPVLPMSRIVGPLDQLRLKKKASKNDPILHQEVQAIIADLSRAMSGGIAATFARAIDSPDGFRERLVQFWADHFSTTTRSNYFALYPLAQAEEAIRPNLTGRFADLLKAAALHPAMITYLDQWRSAGPNSRQAQKRGNGLNENLARELLELHTLGADAGYSQADVHQTAELLTGLTFEIKGARGGYFDPNRAEPGPEWVLGKKYDGEGLAPIHALLEDLAVRPETARHIARKLITHFITDKPDPADVRAVEKAFNDSRGDLMAVYRALLSLDSAAHPDPGKVRQPFDFIAASLRALGVTGASLMAIEPKGLRQSLLEPMTAMGQPFKAPRGPDGAAEDAKAWVTPHGLATRLNWVLTIQRRRRIKVGAVVDPVDFARAALGSRATPALLAALTQIEDRAEAAALTLISPAFNRR